MLIEWVIYLLFNRELLSPYGTSNMVLSVGIHKGVKQMYSCPPGGYPLNREKAKQTSEEMTGPFSVVVEMTAGVEMCGKQD